VIEKQRLCRLAQRDARGPSAREQCFVINDVNFLNNADLDGSNCRRAARRT
jgi:hypothetical protein